MRPTVALSYNLGVAKDGIAPSVSADATAGQWRSWFRWAPSAAHPSRVHISAGTPDGPRRSPLKRPAIAATPPASVIRFKRTHILLFSWRVPGRAALRKDWEDRRPSGEAPGQGQCHHHALRRRRSHSQTIEASFTLEGSRLLPALEAWGHELSYSRGLYVSRDRLAVRAPNWNSAPSPSQARVPAPSELAECPLVMVERGCRRASLAREAQGRTHAAVKLAP